MANLNAFSDNVEMALGYASRLAQKLRTSKVGSEHLLYGLAKTEDSTSSKILAESGVTADAIEMVLEDTASMFFGGSAVEMTPEVKEALRIAGDTARKLNHSFIGTEHLLYAVLSIPNCIAVKILMHYFNVSVSNMKMNVLSFLQGESTKTSATSQTKSTLPESLLKMGVDVNLKVKEGKIDPVVGREEEIERIIQILCRKTKNNPVLIGEAGVGKTAVVEGLAQAIVSGAVPELLANKTVYSLEIGSLMAGTKYRGSMEEKLKNAIETIIKQKNIIVFIDELHTLAQSGSEKGEISPADMLKPYLARGELQTIGATTTDEYRKFIEKDKALERRFQPITTDPPTVEDTIEILRGIKDSYEAFHKITITDEAIKAAAMLSDRYIMDRSLPDKAIDLIDEAASKAKVNFNFKPLALREKEEKLRTLQANRDEASTQRNYEKAAKLQSQIINLENEISSLKADFEKRTSQAKNFIGENDIAEVVSKWTGIPVTKITETEKEKLVQLESIIHKRVVGQEEAVQAVSKAIRRARVGFQDAKRPIGTFLFMGQTGVGKTELSKAIAEAMFDNENNIIRVDMSEYMEPHSVAKLIGAPPGYVGYDEGGWLTEQVRRKPYSVVLFDEIEKAHPDVLNAMLQILDDGRLTDSQNRTTSFRNTIIIMTSNVGATAGKTKPLGFGTESPEKTFEENKSVYMSALKKAFKPEFINRIDVVCVFQPLTKDNLKDITKIIIDNLNARLKSQNLKIEVSNKAIDKIITDACEDSEYGARPLKRYIQKQVEDVLAEKLLSGELEENKSIKIDVLKGKLTFKN